MLLLGLRLILGLSLLGSSLCLGLTAALGTGLLHLVWRRLGADGASGTLDAF
jgi:hypothetical protein